MTEQAGGDVAESAGTNSPERPDGGGRQIDFYHLQSVEPEKALVKLVSRSIEAGRKALIQCPRPAAEAVDEALWSAEPQSWIPHGLDDDEGAECSKAWVLSKEGPAPLDAEFLFLMHGAERSDMSSFERVFNLFDGRSEAQVQQARSQWKSWKQNGDAELRYFKQDEAGKWEQSG